MVYLILCYPNDEVATAVYSRLLEDNPNTLLVTSNDLIFATSWVQKISEDGSCITTITLQNGITINSDKLVKVFNRIGFFKMNHFINTVDRAYAEMEFYALFVSFLKNISNVLFQPFNTADINFQVLTNNLYFFSTAAKCGLDVMDCELSTAPKWDSSPKLQPFSFETNTYLNHDVFQQLLFQEMPATFVETHKRLYKIVVAGNQVFGDVVRISKEKILSFSKAINKSFIELIFAETLGGLKLFSVEVFPPQAEVEVVNALAAEMQ